MCGDRMTIPMWSCCTFTCTKSPRSIRPCPGILMRPVIWNGPGKRPRPFLPIRTRSTPRITKPTSGVCTMNWLCSNWPMRWIRRACPRRLPGYARSGRRRSSILSMTTNIPSGPNMRLTGPRLNPPMPLPNMGPRTICCLTRTCGGTSSTRNGIRTPWSVVKTHARSWIVNWLRAWRCAAGWRQTTISSAQTRA